MNKEIKGCNEKLESEDKEKSNAKRNGKLEQLKKYENNNLLYLPQMIRLESKVMGSKLQIV